MNSDVRELNKGACTQGACMRARLETIIRFFFSTGKVCPNIGKMKSVVKLNSNVRGTYKGPCNGPCKGLCMQGACVCACTLRISFGVLFLSGIVSNNIGET